MPPQDPIQPQGPEPAQPYTPSLAPVEPVYVPQQPEVATAPAPVQPVVAPGQPMMPQPVQAVPPQAAIIAPEFQAGPNQQLATAPPAPQGVASPVQPAIAPQMAQQPMMPQQPTVQPMGGMMPQQTQPFYPIAGGSPGKGGLTKKLILAGIGMVTLIIAGIVIFVLYQKLGGGIPTYSVTDIKEYKATSYSAAAPKQWTDVSDKDGIKKELAKGEAAQIKDVKIHAYKYNDSNTTYQAALLTGYTPFPASDGMLKQVLDSTYKTEFEKEIKNSFGDIKDENCSGLTKGPVGIEYNTERFVVDIAGSYDCTLKADIAKKRGVTDVHYEFRAGIKSGKGYLSYLVVTQDDWRKNKNFYTNDLLSNLKPL